MRLALRDVKKTVRRRDGVAFVTPYLLRPRERLRELEALVALHEAWIGRARATFPTERAAELVGDYRLARCLVACLGEWYEWRGPAWPGAGSGDETGGGPPPRPSPPRRGGPPAPPLLPTRAPRPPPPAARAAGDAEQELDGAGRPVVVTLFGPQGVTGSPNQYGDRLARLCRALLGYRRANETEGSAALATSGLEGVARVHLNGRPLLFPLDERVLKLLRSEAPAEDERTGRSPAGESFDSMLERRLHAEFVALERDSAAHGWRLEREPAPVIARDAIMVPDFALTRGHRRVYLEIVGYWRPDYRERKLRKLAALHGAVALVLAVPSAARAEFAALEANYPVLWFDRRVSAAALLALLDRQYDDLDERLARLDLPAISREVAQRGRIAPAESMTLLHCYTRNELARALGLLHAAVATADEPAVAWLDGLRLASADWGDRLLTQTRGVLEAAPGGRLALEVLCAGLVARLPELAGIAEETGEQVAAQAGPVAVPHTVLQARAALGLPTAHAAPNTWDTTFLD